MRRAGTSHEKEPSRTDSSSTVALNFVASTSTRIRYGIESRMSTKSHQDPVDDAAHEACDRPIERADHGRDQGRQEADLERGLTAQHDPAEFVEAVVVCAEQVAAAGGEVGDQRVGIRLVRRVDDRPDEAEEHEEDQHHHADDGQPVGGELTQREPPPALDRLDVSTVGGGALVTRQRDAADSTEDRCAECRIGALLSQCGSSDRQRSLPRRRSGYRATVSTPPRIVYASRIG